MSRRFRVGVVGGGVVLNHIQAYRELPDLYSVDAFCDIDPLRAERVRSEFGNGRIATSLDTPGEEIRRIWPQKGTLRDLRLERELRFDDGSYGALDYAPLADLYLRHRLFAAESES